MQQCLLQHKCGLCLLAAVTLACAWQLPEAKGEAIIDLGIGGDSGPPMMGQATGVDLVVTLRSAAPPLPAAATKEMICSTARALLLAKLNRYSPADIKLVESGNPTIVRTRPTVYIDCEIERSDTGEVSISLAQDEFITCVSFIGFFQVSEPIVTGYDPLGIYLAARPLAKDQPLGKTDLDGLLQDLLAPVIEHLR